MEGRDHPEDRHDVFARNSVSRQVLDLIANKWTTLTICVLSLGTKRYSELEREIDGLSQKMLTQTLRRLERDGLVERKVYPVVPPKVEYSLTPLGETLIGLLGSLREWAEVHLNEVEAARTRHDREVQ
ncbi:helix-turn-helix domain-containing protein [soil metagenome]|jgi:DNA-binding HxlR family transcriptional regulator